MKRIACGVLVGLFAALDSLPAEACFAGGAAPGDLVREADVIVRVRAVDTSTEPAMSVLDRSVTTVRFLVLEQLKGEERLFDLAVRGSGSTTCFAATYQRGAEYLMFLKLSAGALTPYWQPLAPTNKEVHGADDPWVARVHKELALGPPAVPPTRFRVTR